mgnify:CR=1 FL=1
MVRLQGKNKESIVSELWEIIHIKMKREYDLTNYIGGEL